MMVQFMCWIASHGECQRFGATSTGRYRTDFNGLSLERSGLLPSPGLRADRVFGIAQASTEFVYHSLSMLDDPGMAEQYSFWQSIFGPEQHGRLYYFSVADRSGFLQRPEIPIGNFLRLKSFFVTLEEQACGNLISRLRDEGCEQPWPADPPPTLCVRVPVAFAQKIFEGEWSHFALPEPALEQLFHGAERQRSRLMGWSHCPFSAINFAQPPFPPAGTAEPFTHATASFVADTVRMCYARLTSAGVQDADLLQCCHYAAHYLQSFQDELDPANAQASALAIRGRLSSTSSRLPYNALFLVKCLILCFHLRDASTLRRVLERAVDIIVPTGFAEAVLQPLKGGELKVPSASKISRARLTVDVGFMLSRQEANKSTMRNSVQYVMADSSVQGHHDFELIRSTRLDLSMASDMFLAALELVKVWANQVEGHVANQGYDLSSHERRLYDVICPGLSTHLFPSVVIGCGHASLYHKFHSLMHAFWLETGDAVSLADFAKSVFSFTTDQGTEASFSKVPVVKVSTLFPWVPVPGPFEVIEEHAWAPPPDAAALHHAAQIDLSASVGIPGMLHIVHNSSRDLARGMPNFDPVVSQIQHVSRLLRRHGSRERLLQTCYNDPAGRVLQASIRKFHAKVNVGRWGSLAECVKQLLELEPILRWGWDMSKYGQARHDAAEGIGVDIRVVDGAITCANFWGYLRMLSSLTRMVQAALTWSESCICHGQLDFRELPPDVRQQWARCPLRGCRAPELAAGEFMTVLRQVSSSSLAHFMTTLPRDIDAAARASLLDEYQRGKSHLLFVLSMRLQHWRVAPWSIFGCAHLNTRTSKDFVRRSLGLASQHPLVLEFQTGELAEQANHYLAEGSNLKELPLLSQFFSKLLFCPIAERPVEGDHAQARPASSIIPSHP